MNERKILQNRICPTFSRGRRKGKLLKKEQYREGERKPQEPFFKGTLGASSSGFCCLGYLGLDGYS